jgi:hypothetical protein
VKAKNVDAGAAACVEESLTLSWLDKVDELFLGQCL